MPAARPHRAARTFLRYLREKVSLRLHMSLMLAAVLAAGLLCGKGLLLLGLSSPAWRYALVALLAYGIFFLIVRAWLAYIVPFEAARRADRSNDLDPDLSQLNAPGDLMLDLPGAPPGPAPMITGGGEFGGGGASGSFTADLPAPTGDGTALPAARGGSGGFSIGDLGDIDDPRGLLIVVAIGALVAVLCGGAVFLVYQAPVILSEVVFEFLLSLGMLRATRRMRDGNWSGSVFRSTWKPFALIFATAVSVGLALEYLCPGQPTLPLVYQHCVAGRLPDL